MIVTTESYGKSMKLVNEIACAAKCLAKVLTKSVKDEDDFDFEERGRMNRREYDGMYYRDNDDMDIDNMSEMELKEELRRLKHSRYSK